MVLQSFLGPSKMVSTSVWRIFKLEEGETRNKIKTSAKSSGSQYLAIVHELQEVIAITLPIGYTERPWRTPLASFKHKTANVNVKANTRLSSFI